MKKTYFIIFILFFSAMLTTVSFNCGCLNSSASRTADNLAAKGIEDADPTQDAAKTPVDTSGTENETTAPVNVGNLETPSINEDDVILEFTVITKEINELESDGKREIIAKYPYFEHQDSEDIFYAANNTIKNDYIDFWINDFRDITDEAFEYMREDTPGPLGLDINYSIEYMDNRCVSILLYSFSYTGGAHPNTFSSSYNYDIEKRKDILLYDLFAEGYNYLGFLSSYCYEDIKNKYTEIDVDPADMEDWIIDGTDPSKPDNFRDFNLTADSLMITFDPYEVGPYAMGAFIVFVPYAEFKGNILYP